MVAANTPRRPAERGKITAVLGPTNTGKTHLAMERMLGYRSGMIGFPLRLLARENYDRAVAVKGAAQVALVTGEEKIVPPNARYFLCTVEAMPTDEPVDFLAIDEIQVCGDPDRGHVFTDRLLHARGLHETLFLGAESMRPIIRRLVPDADFETRPRLSKLSYAGQQKLHRLKPRSAVVAFTANDVYALAEVLRRQRGGAAVVLGALSPRTRNAQVAMYQAGEVDYLVATDAIGMGLNMDVRNVTFASTRKFDGRKFRPLHAAELAQIAGRAGRHANDGTFGLAPEAGELQPETIARIEEHDFDPLRHVYWRSDDLDFANVDALLASLRSRSDVAELARVREADDERALATLGREAHILERNPRGDDLALLWEVCQVPDFEKQWSASHGRFLDQVYRHLTSRDACLPEDWIAEHIDRIDRTDGGIDTLMGRISRVRTWTYLSHKSAWMADADHWQARSREIEDKLSDALHDGLTQRFVDKRTAALLGGLRDKRTLAAAVKADGDVLVEGQYVGRLEGLQFYPDETRFKQDRRAILGSVMPVVTQQVRTLVGQIMTSGDGLAWERADTVTWRGEAIARVRKGRDLYEPIVSLLPNGALEGETRERFARWLQAWVDERIKSLLAPLMQKTSDAPPSVRGLIFRLRENLGAIRRREIENEIKTLEQAERRILTQAGFRIGRESVFSPVLLKPAAMQVRANLWVLHYEPAEPCVLPDAGLFSVKLSQSKTQRLFHEAMGFHVFPAAGHALALRVDMIDKLADACWTAIKKGPFALTGEIMSFTALGEDATVVILKAIGFREKTIEDERRFVVAHKRPARKQPKKTPEEKPSAKRRRPRKPKVPSDSPFAVLADHFSK